LYTFGVIIAASVIPAIIYLVIIRNSERVEREKWGSIILSFLWGAVPAVLIACVLEWLLSFEAIKFLLPIMMAPIVEELCKPLILLRLKKEINELEDGIIYGASAAIGFACVENIVYYLAAYIYGETSILVMTIILRTVASYMTHISATGITGYGVARNIIIYKNPKLMSGFLILAIVIHALYNSACLYLGGIGAVIAIVMTVFCFCLLRKTIKEFDQRQAGLT
jgi:RsiW-degrading membrane proteinase PrsW (M82 family)